MLNVWPFSHNVPLLYSLFVNKRLFIIYNTIYLECLQRYCTNSLFFARIDTLICYIPLDHTLYQVKNLSHFGMSISLCPPLSYNSPHHIPILLIDYGIHCPKKASWELKTYMMQKDIMNILRLPNNKNNKCPNCICGLLIWQDRCDADSSKLYYHKVAALV